MYEYTLEDMYIVAFEKTSGRARSSILVWSTCSRGLSGVSVAISLDKLH